MTQVTNNFNYSVTQRQDYRSMALAPIELTRSAVKTAQAYFAQDTEGVIDGVAKVTGTLDLLISGASATIRALIYLGMWVEKDVLTGELPKFFSMILLPYAILGLVLSFFELGYEAINLYWGISLRSELKFSKKTKDLIHNREWIRDEYFKLNMTEKDEIDEYLYRTYPKPEQVELRRTVYAALEKKILQNKFQSLCRRISTPAALELVQMIDSHRVEDFKAITKIVDLQTRKMILMRSIGLFSIILSTLCYAFMIATFPYVAFVTLGLALGSILFYLLYYALDKGYFNQPGTHFSIKACIPDWAKRVFNCGRTVVAAQHPLSLREIQLMDMRIHAAPNHR